VVFQDETGFTLHPRLGLAIIGDQGAEGGRRFPPRDAPGTLDNPLALSSGKLRWIAPRVTGVEMNILK
jgi:hypothetical protein